MGHPPGRIYPGWWIVLATASGQLIQGGFVFWCMGLYTATFEDVFGAPRAQINLIETCLTVATNLLSPVAGILIDRWSIRHLMIIGMVAMGLGLLILSQAGTLFQVWVVWASLIPLGVLLIGAIPSAALVSRWFIRRRGLALGLTATGSSLGGFLVPPLMTWLFLEWDWRTGLQVGACICFAVIPIFFWLLRNEPADLGLSGEPNEASANSSTHTAKTITADAGDWGIPQLLRSQIFWLQMIVSGSLLAVTLGMLANLSLHAKDLGVTGQSTAVLYSIIAICSFSGKALTGYLMDRFGIQRCGYLICAFLSSGLMILLSVQNYSGLVAGAFVMGLGYGGVVPLWTNMPARAFGAGSVGRALGIMNPLHIPVTATSAPLAGYISDTTGSYDGVFWMYGTCCAVAAIGLTIMGSVLKSTGNQ
ncbi:MAG: MFS transporter [Halieaceae bacterium]